jgi:DNA polymerase elongation subunit (family B)
MYMGTQLKSGSLVETIKGMASARRDRPEICRQVLRAVCYAICTESKKEAFHRIAKMLHRVDYEIRIKNLPLRYCMLETKDNAMLVWTYYNAKMRKVTLDKKTDLTRYRGYPSQEWLIRSVIKTVDPILKVCNMPSYAQCVEYISRLEDAL